MAADNNNKNRAKKAHGSNPFKPNTNPSGGNATLSSSSSDIKASGSRTLGFNPFAQHHRQGQQRRGSGAAERSRVAGSAASATAGTGAGTGTGKTLFGRDPGGTRGREFYIQDRERAESGRRRRSKDPRKNHRSRDREAGFSSNSRYPSGGPQGVKRKGPFDGAYSATRPPPNHRRKTSEADFSARRPTRRRSGEDTRTYGYNSEPEIPRRPQRRFEERQRRPHQARVFNEEEEENEVVQDAGHSDADFLGPPQPAASDPPTKPSSVTSALSSNGIVTKFERYWIRTYVNGLFKLYGLQHQFDKADQLVDEGEDHFREIGWIGEDLDELRENPEKGEYVLAWFNAGFLGIYVSDFFDGLSAEREALALREQNKSGFEEVAGDIDASDDPYTFFKDRIDKGKKPVRDGAEFEAIVKRAEPKYFAPSYARDGVQQALNAAMAPQLNLTPMLGQFLVQINNFVRSKDDQKLGELIVLEPPFGGAYEQIIQELKKTFPKGRDDGLEERVSHFLTAARDGLDGSPSWTPFIIFMVHYLKYLRDVSADPNKYLETYNQLAELQKRVNSALSHKDLGYLVLPAVVSCAKLVCRLAIGLDKQPELIANLRSAQAGDHDSEEGMPKTLPERAAELLRFALTTCLNDRFSGLDAFGRPEGKKKGIYKIANLCLKIFFQCRKTRNAETIFTNIGNMSPPLAAYCKRERVTYLYYLGRYWFQNSQFYRAQKTLEAAYDECPARNECTQQRRKILIFLIASNIIMGRFPTPAIFQRPEAQGLHDHFWPLMMAIRSGNVATFRQLLDIDGPHAEFFLHYRMLLQLWNRCEVLVWRSLVRKTWILNGTRYDPTGVSKAAPLVDVHDLRILFAVLEQQSSKPEDEAHIDPDFDGAYDDGEQDPDSSISDTARIESILTSLIDQGFIHGYLAHAKGKFVIMGAKQAGGDVLATGFPLPARVVARKMAAETGGQDPAENDVPGWKVGSLRTGGATAAATAAGGGMVVNLSGARPVGVA